MPTQIEKWRVPTTSKTNWEMSCSNRDSTVTPRPIATTHVLQCILLLPSVSYNCLSIPLLQLINNHSWCVASHQGTDFRLSWIWTAADLIRCGGLRFRVRIWPWSASCPVGGLSSWRIIWRLFAVLLCWSCERQHSMAQRWRHKKGLVESHHGSGDDVCVVRRKAIKSQSSYLL